MNERKNISRFVSDKDRTPQYEAAVKALAGIPNPHLAFAEAVSDIRLCEWVKAQGVTRAKGHICLAKLAGRKCPNERWSPPWEDTDHRCLPKGSDHTSMWSRNGKPFLIVTQPYGLNSECLESMLASAKELGLKLWINGRPSWHFPGATLSVIFCRQGVRIFE